MRLIMTASQQTSRLENIHKKLSQVASFLCGHLQFANSHVTYFFSDDLWQKAVPPNVADALLQLTDEELSVLPTGQVLEMDATAHELQKNQARTKQHGTDSLRELLIGIQKHTLPRLDVLTDIEKLNCDHHAGKILIKDFMSPKKSHEVDVMANLCASLAQQQGISKVIDIGSGRGYLGCQLAFMHGLDVLGADASDGNTHSAQARTQHLDRQWDGLMRRAQTVNESTTEQDSDDTSIRREQRQSEATTKKSKSKKRSSSLDKAPKAENSNSSQIFDAFTQETDVATSSGAEKEQLEKLHDDSSSNERLEDTISKASASLPDGSTVESQSSHQRGSFISTTQLITSDTNILEILRSHFPHTHQGEPVMLTGLHTCGALASDTLRLFVEHDCIQTVSSVGCCYHLMQEDEKEVGSYEEPEEKGFPLSQCLRDQEYKLGRNARMLAQQAPERVAHELKLPGRSLFWRAVLQVILQDLTAEPRHRNQWKVGRIAAKCTNFQEYVLKALTKLNLQHLKITEEEVEKYLQKYQPMERRLQAYIQLRMALAPCIEGLILLDRMVYLLEQPSIKEAHLVQLFDPVTSPRCYALVAVKHCPWV